MSAGPRRGNRRYAVAAAVCLGAVVWLLFGALRGNVVYYRTVSEAVHQRDTGSTARFRLAGQVVDGSVRRTTDGVVFRVTDGAATAAVVHHGDPPELFADGVPVVCEGHWDGARFASDRIMIRHGSEYEPPEVTTTVPGTAAGHRPVR